MINFLKIFLGWRGTWFWACRQMMAGKTVYRLRDSGHVTFSYDHGIRKIKAMIEWETSTEPKEWGISMEDVFATDFMLVHENTDYSELHRQSQMKIDDKPLKEGLTKRHIKKQSAFVDMGPAPKPIKPPGGQNNDTFLILDYMRSTIGFTEQPDTHGRRFHYSINNEPVAYVIFKHIWGGYKLIPYANGDDATVVKSVDHFKNLIYHINIQHLTT